MGRTLKIILRIFIGILLSPCLLGAAVLALFAVISALFSTAVDFLAGEEEAKAAWEHGRL